MPSNKMADVDPLRHLADKLREKKGVPWASAKLELNDGDGEYVEFFRGKDFARHLRANPALMEPLMRSKPGRAVEDQIRDVGNAMLQRGLVRRTDRKYKRPKPGQKRLVKFPRTLEVSHSNSWEETAFYAWRYDRPTSIWYYMGSVAIPVAVILACLFPLAPWWVRMGVVYALMGLLVVLLSLLSLRYAVFGAVWMTTGHSLWIFPNMISDEVSLFEAFSPVISYDRPDKGGLAAQWKQRMATAAVTAGVLWVLYSHSPDVAHIKEEAMRAHDSLFDYLDLAGKHRSYLEGATNGTGQGQGGGKPA